MRDGLVAAGEGEERFAPTLGSVEMTTDGD